MKVFSMIKKVSRQNLDIEKYNKCLTSSVNYLVYAEIWFLDVVIQKKWDCLVLNDYEAIMPLPFIKKFGVKFITQPIHCQQLGVFHQHVFTQNQFLLFENYLKKRLVKGYNFNESNTVQFNPKGSKMINQTLVIDENYKESLSKMVNRNINFFNKQNLTIQADLSIDEMLEFKSKHKNHELDLLNFKQILNELVRQNSLQILSVKNQDLIGYICFLMAKNRIIYLDSAVSEVGKKLKVPTGIINHILEDNKGLILDFEGSSIPAIQKFYKGFGAEINYYTHYSNLPKF